MAGFVVVNNMANTMIVGMGRLIYTLWKQSITQKFSLLLLQIKMKYILTTLTCVFVLSFIAVSSHSPGIVGSLFEKYDFNLAKNVRKKERHLSQENWSGKCFYQFY